MMAAVTRGLWEKVLVREEGVGGGGVEGWWGVEAGGVGG